MKILIPFILGTLLFCGSDYRFIDEKLREKGEFFYMKNFTHQFFDNQAGSQWLLEAKEAFLPSRALELSGEHVIAYDFTFRQYTKAKKLRFLLRAKRGELDKAKQKLFLEGKILYKDEERRELASEKMEYDFTSQVLSSTHAVQLKQPGVTSLCKKGIEINLLTKRQHCRAPYIKQSRVSGIP